MIAPATSSNSQMGLDAPLSTLYLELTAACHNACPGCSNVFAHSDPRPGLSAIDWGRVFERLAAHRPHLRFTGGEPTLHPEFEQIVDQAQVMGFAFSVFTNGGWRETERIVRFLTSLTGLECILVSLHGAQPQSHEAFTAIPGSFGETVANIRRAAEAGVRVSTSTVITRQNYAEMPEVIALSQALGARQAVFNRFIGAAMPAVEANSDQIKTAVAAVEYAGHDGSTGRVKFGTPIPHCFTPNGSNGCMAGFAHITVDPWGNVRPCPHVPLIAGNLLTEPLDAILQGPIMQEWRQGYLTQCAGCDQHGNCFAGCRAAALLHPSRRDPFIS